MTISRILSGLEAIDLTGADAAQVARMGFLEWAFCAQGGGTPEAAQAALTSPEVLCARSDAALAFVGYLRDATQRITRSGRRRKRLVH